MSEDPARTFERKFFDFAKWHLACRLRAMNGDVIGARTPKGNLEFTLLGLRDFAIAMWVLCQNQKGHEVEFRPGQGWFTK